MIPLVYILFFARYWREYRKKPLEYWERPMLVAIVGFFLLLSVARAPDWVRMAAVSLPALILLGWLLDSPRKLARTLVLVLTAGALLVALRAVARQRPIPVGILVTPQGKLAFTGQIPFQVTTWIQQHTRSLDYFYDPMDPELSFVLNLRNPTPLTLTVNSGYMTQEQVTEVIRGLEQHQVHYILWVPDGLDKLPGWENPSDDHLGPLRDFIHGHYTRVKVFPGADEIWEKQAEQGR